MYFVTRNKWKITICLLFFFFTPVFAVESAELQDIVPENEIVSSACGDMSFQVEGSFFVKPNQNAVYTINSNSILDQQANIEYELRQKDVLLEVGKEHQFRYLFTTPATYVLKTILRRSESCVQAIEQIITVSDHIRLAVGFTDNENTFLAQAVQDQ